MTNNTQLSRLKNRLASVRPQRPAKTIPWEVESKSGFWYIVKPGTKQKKRIGPVKTKGTNYYDKAVQEAAKRNAHLPTP